MPHTERPRFTVIGTAPHLQAGDSALRPVSVLFSDPDNAAGPVAELRLTAAEARDLAHLLVRHAADTDPAEIVYVIRGRPGCYWTGSEWGPLASAELSNKDEMRRHPNLPAGGVWHPVRADHIPAA